jgi:glycerol-1-phosphate dehydrogenase [NAD(P)+]
VPVLARMVGAPLHVAVRRSALAELPLVLGDRRLSNQGNIALVVGAGMGGAVVAALPPDLATAGVFTVADDSVEAAIELSRELQHRIVDIVVAVGGGRTLDVTKYAASRVGLPVVVVATSLAHDGLASPVSVLTVDGESVSFGVTTPLGVLVDLDLVQRSPHALVASGVADVVSNLSAVADWELAAEHRAEPLDGLACMLARSAAESVLRHRGDPRGIPFLRCLAEALILSGTAMAVAGTSRPCSGACHEISHAIDQLFPGRATHGQQVGVGMLFATFLRGDETTFASAGACLAHHGLPLDHRDLGLEDAEFVKAILHAPDTRPDRYTVLEHLAPPEADLAELVSDFSDAVRGGR